MSHLLLVRCMLTWGVTEAAPPHPHPVNPWVLRPVMAHEAGSGVGLGGREVAQKGLACPGRGASRTPSCTQQEVRKLLREDLRTR